MFPLDNDVLLRVLRFLDLTSLCRFADAVRRNEQLFQLALSYRLRSKPVNLHDFYIEDSIKIVKALLKPLISTHDGRLVPGANIVRHLNIMDWGSSMPSVPTYDDDTVALAFQDLLEQMMNLREFSWVGLGIPTTWTKWEAMVDSERLPLLENKPLRSISLGLPEPSLITALSNLTSLPDVHSLTLNSLSEESFKTFESVAYSFKFITDLNLDVTYGEWDWDGAGSPQAGATSQYPWATLDLPNVTRFDLRVSDLTLTGSNQGPIVLVPHGRLKELVIRVQNNLAWVTLHIIRMFQALDPSGFISLETFELHDEHHYPPQRSWEELPGTGDPDRLHNNSRFYLGIDRFISGLPVLKQLHVDHRVLVSMGVHDDDSWSGNDLNFLPLDEVFRHQEWTEFRSSLGRLSSLRVGLGKIKEEHLVELLQWCDPSLLGRLGFEWDWPAHGKDQPFSGTFLTLLSQFTKLRDIHITHRPPLTPSPWSDPYTISLVTSIFDACPNVARVGMGSFMAWERNSTPNERRIRLVDFPKHVGFAPGDFLPDFYKVGDDYTLDLHELYKLRYFISDTTVAAVDTDRNTPAASPHASSAADSQSVQVPKDHHAGPSQDLLRQWATPSPSQFAIPPNETIPQARERERKENERFNALLQETVEQRDERTWLAEALSQLTAE